MSRGTWLVEHVRRVAGRQPHADIVMAAVLFAVTLITTTAGPHESAPATSTVLAAAIACGVLVARRRWPVPVLAVSVVAGEWYMAPYGGQRGMIILAAPLIALYTVAESAARRNVLLVGCLVVIALAGAHAFVKASNWLGADNVAMAALGGLAVAAGEASRHRRAYLAEVEERARRAEGDRELEARRRVTQERLRIARDLHDVVGHHLALINVQAGVAGHVLDERPDQARESLAHIRQASRAALEELRDTIGLLREPDEPAAPVEPTVGLAALRDLLAAFRGSGLHIDETTGGQARPLPAAADVTAYRVIQEALTNVCKHGRRPVAELRLEYDPGALTIRVQNPGQAAAGVDYAGHGIVGMRERVTALGGSLRAGARPDGAFLVVATLPLPGPTAVPDLVPGEAA